MQRSLPSFQFALGAGSAWVSYVEKHREQLMKSPLVSFPGTSCITLPEILVCLINSMNERLTAMKCDHLLIRVTCCHKLFFFIASTFNFTKPIFSEFRHDINNKLPRL